MTSFSTVMFISAFFCCLVVIVLIILMTKNHCEYPKSKLVAVIIFIVILTILMTLDITMALYQLQSNNAVGDFGVILN